MLRELTACHLSLSYRTGQLHSTLLWDRTLELAAPCAHHSSAEHSWCIAGFKNGAEPLLAVRAVTMNGEPVAMTKGETELELIPFVEGGELLVMWQAHREGLGEAVEITTSAPRPPLAEHAFMT